MRNKISLLLLGTVFGTALLAQSAQADRCSDDFRAVANRLEASLHGEIYTPAAKARVVEKLESMFRAMYPAAQIRSEEIRELLEQRYPLVIRFDFRSDYPNGDRSANRLFAATVQLADGRREVVANPNVNIPCGTLPTREQFLDLALLGIAYGAQALPQFQRLGERLASEVRSQAPTGTPQATVGSDQATWDARMAEMDAALARFQAILDRMNANRRSNLDAELDRAEANIARLQNPDEMAQFLRDMVILDMARQKLNDGLPGTLPVPAPAVPEAATPAQ